MKIDNNQLLPVLVTCTGSRYKISKLNKELFNFHVITTKVSSNYINKIVFSGSCFQEKNCCFTDQSSVQMCADRKTIVRNPMKICNKTDDNLSALSVCESINLNFRAAEVLERHFKKIPWLQRSVLEISKMR